jgi:hypothetical protein
VQTCSVATIFEPHSLGTMDNSTTLAGCHCLTLSYSTTRPQQWCQSHNENIPKFPLPFDFPSHLFFLFVHLLDESHSFKWDDYEWHWKWWGSGRGPFNLRYSCQRHLEGTNLTSHVNNPHAHYVLKRAAGNSTLTACMHVPPRQRKRHAFQILDFDRPPNPRRDHSLNWNGSHSENQWTTTTCHLWSLLWPPTENDWTIIWDVRFSRWWRRPHWSSEALNMETVCISETLASTFESTRRQNPKRTSSSPPWKPQI